MAQFLVREVKEIIIEGTIDAINAEQAMIKFKGRERNNLTKMSEESHITIKAIEVEANE